MKAINFLNIPPANICHLLPCFLLALFSFKVLYDSDKASTASKEFLCLTASALLKVTEPLIIIRRFSLGRNHIICNQMIPWTQTLHQPQITGKQGHSQGGEKPPSTLADHLRDNRVTPLRAAQLTRTCSSKGRARGRSHFLLLLSSLYRQFHAAVLGGEQARLLIPNTTDLLHSERMGF